MWYVCFLGIYFRLYCLFYRLFCKYSYSSNGIVILRSFDIPCNVQIQRRITIYQTLECCISCKINLDQSDSNQIIRWGNIHLLMFHVISLCKMFHQLYLVYSGSIDDICRFWCVNKKITILLKTNKNKVIIKMYK